MIGKLIGGDVGAPQLLGAPRPSSAAVDDATAAEAEVTAASAGVLLDGFEAPAVRVGCACIACACTACARIVLVLHVLELCVLVLHVLVLHVLARNVLHAC